MKNVIRYSKGTPQERAALKAACEAHYKIIAIDPDTKKPSGLACLTNGTGTGTLVLCEAQELHLGRRIDPRGILHLANCAGVVAGQVAAACHAPIAFVTPSFWKGSYPKPKSLDPEEYIIHAKVLRSPIMTPRLLKQYQEQLAAVKPNNRLEVVDAWGILICAMSGQKL